jgi:hypothetical protein
MDVKKVKKCEKKDPCPPNLPGREVRVLPPQGFKAKLP